MRMQRDNRIYVLNQIKRYCLEIQQEKLKPVRKTPDEADQLQQARSPCYPVLTPAFSRGVGFPFRPDRTLQTFHLTPFQPLKLMPSTYLCNIYPDKGKRD